MLTSGYQAEYGKASGIQITAVTKSGTNQFRGSIYDVHRDSDWNSNSWANIKNGNAKSVNKEDDWGYSIGGPIGKPGGRNKLFFFFSQEWKPRTTAGALNRFRFPTALERAGDFSQSRDNNGNVFNLIRNASTNLPCTAANTTGCYQDGGVVGRIPAERALSDGAEHPEAVPDAEPRRAPASRYNYEAPAPEIKTLNNQPTIRRRLSADHSRSGRSSATRPKVQRQRDVPGLDPRLQRRPDAEPDHRDVSPPRVNYTINADDVPRSDLRADSERARRLHDAQRRLRQRRADGCSRRTRTTSGWAACRSSSRMASGWTRATTSTRPSNRMAPPFWQNGQIMLPPTFTWGNRIGNAPPNIAYPAWLNLNRTHRLLAQPDEGLGPAHHQDRLLQPLQLQGAEPRHRRPELRRARRHELRQQHQQPD